MDPTQPSTSAVHDEQPQKSESDKPVFKKPRRLPPVQPRRRLEDEDADDATSDVVSDLKMVQNLRKRAMGISVTALAYGDAGVAAEKAAAEAAAQASLDPLKMESGGGIVDLKKLRRADWAHVNVEENLKQNFSRESHLRDEDEEMRRYVEEKLGKMKGSNDESSTEQGAKKTLTEDELYLLPERLKSLTSRKNEDMLSQQMLSGIPEVDLGIEAKIKNIEETETAKLRLLKELGEKQKSLEQATTANQNLAKELAKSYVQHDRFKIDKFTALGSSDKVERVNTTPVVVVDEDTPRWVLMEKTPGGTHKRQLRLLAKPNDEHEYRRMKKKIENANK